MTSDEKARGLYQIVYSDGHIGAPRSWESVLNWIRCVRCRKPRPLRVERYNETGTTA